MFDARGRQRQRLQLAERRVVGRYLLLALAQRAERIACGQGLGGRAQAVAVGMGLHQRGNPHGEGFQLAGGAGVAGVQAVQQGVQMMLRIRQHGAGILG